MGVLDSLLQRQQRAPAPTLDGVLGLGATPDADPAPYGPDALTQAPGYDPLGPTLKAIVADTVRAPGNMVAGAYNTLVGTPMDLLEHGGTRQQLADAAIGAAGMMTAPLENGPEEAAGMGALRGKNGAVYGDAGPNNLSLGHYDATPNTTYDSRYAAAQKYAPAGSPANEMLATLTGRADIHADDFVNQLFGPAAANIKAEPYGYPGNMGLQLSTRLQNDDGSFLGNIERVFNQDNTVHHALFGLDKSAQGQGLSKQILGSQIPLYNQLGLDAATVNAGLQNGGYTWGRYGFTPDQASWDSLRDPNRGVSKMLTRFAPQISPETLDATRSALAGADPQGLWTVADARDPVPYRGGPATIPLGNDLLSGSSWRGALDLSDPASMARFNSYIGKSNSMTLGAGAGARGEGGLQASDLAKGALAQPEQPLGDLGSQMSSLLQHGDLLSAMHAKTDDLSASFPAFQPPPVSYVDPAAQQWSLFHGSTPGPDFTANGGRFDPYFGNKPGGQEAGALFMSPSPEEASHYAGSLSDHGQEAGNRVFPLTVRSGRSALFDLPDMVRNDPTFRDEVVSNLTPEYGADAARQKADYALSDLDSQHQVNAQLSGMGLPTQPPTVHWMSGVTDAAVKRAQAQGLDTAVIRGLSESNGGDQIVALKPGTVFSRTTGEQLYNGGLALPTQPSALPTDPGLLARWIAQGGA